MLDYEEDELPRPTAARQQGEGGDHMDEGEPDEEEQQDEGQAAAAVTDQQAAAVLAFAQGGFKLAPASGLAAMRALHIRDQCGLHSHPHTNGECREQRQWRYATLQGPQGVAARALLAEQGGDDQHLHQTQRNRQHLHQTQMNRQHLHQKQMNRQHLHQTQMNRQHLHQTQMNQQHLHQTQMIVRERTRSPPPERGQPGRYREGRPQRGPDSQGLLAMALNVSGSGGFFFIPRG